MSVFTRTAALRDRIFGQHKLGAMLFGMALGACLAEAPALLRQFSPVGNAKAEGQQTTDADDLLAQITLFAKVTAQVSAAYVNPVSPKTLVENAFRGMLHGLDAHSGYMTAQDEHTVRGYVRDKMVGIGVELAEQHDGGLVVSTAPGSPARKAGLVAGDLITAIDKRPVSGVALLQIVQRLSGEPGSDVSITVRPAAGRAVREAILRRTVLQVETVDYHLVGDVGYVKIAAFANDTEPGVRRAYAALLAQSGGNLRGLVIDLRNNQGGLIDQAVAVCNDFLADGLVVALRPRHAEDIEKIAAHGADITGGRPIVVLINAGTASAAEIVTGALQDHRRAIVLGDRSFGKGSVQTIMPLDNGEGAIRLTTARYYTPSGRSIQARGITPDIEVQAEREPKPASREADLPNSLPNTDASVPLQPRPDLPAGAGAIPKSPPEGWPANINHGLEHDFQAQQGLAVLHLARAGALANPAGGAAP